MIHPSSVEDESVEKFLGFDSTETLLNKNKPNTSYDKYFMKPMAVKRPSLPKSINVMQRKIFHYGMLFDFMTFKWMKYLDDDTFQNDQINLKDQYITVYLNVGLLSALVLTVSH